MKRNIAYRYRAYPDEVQAVLLQKTFGCARFIWNQMLADIMAYYEMPGLFSLNRACIE